MVTHVAIVSCRAVSALYLFCELLILRQPFPMVLHSAWQNGALISLELSSAFMF